MTEEVRAVGLILGAALAFAADAAAAPKITQSPLTDPVLWELEPAGTNTWDILLTPDTVNDFYTFTIERPDENPTEEVRIDNLIISRPGSVESPETNHRTVVNIGQDAANGRLQSVNSISVVGFYGEQSYVAVFANLDDDLGSVFGVNRLFANIDSGDVGSITAAMHKRASADHSLGAKYYSDIDVTSLSGSLVGSVKMFSGIGEYDRGIIHGLDFRNGTIGSPPPFFPVEIEADGVIENVRGREIHALIRGTDDVPLDVDRDSFVHLIGLVETTGATQNPGDTGRFTGEIRAERFSTDEVLFPLSFFAELAFSGEMDGRIWLQAIDSITQPQSITMPALGLKKTIALGVLTPGGGSSLWDGTVEAGPSIALTSDDADGYTPARTAASLGGGAVGVVPFRTHFDDCFPAFADLVSIPSVHPSDAPSPSEAVVVRHYGPVKLPAGGVRAFTVETRAIGAGPWSDITTCFGESVDTVGTAVMLTPVRKLPGGFEYRVTQAKDGSSNNRLLCDLPVGATIPVASVADFQREFRFTVCDSISLGDAESDGEVNFGDITSVLSNFGLTDCLRMGDADRDGDRDFSDVTEVLSNWEFIYCGGSTQSAVLMANGIQSIDFEGETPMTSTAAAMAVADALATMGYASIEAFTDAIALMDEESRNAEVRRLGRLLEGTP